MEEVRTRFAPSPTGLLHIGGVRTALFNYLFAKRAGGVFILRLEDTDRERFVEASVEQMQTSLDWLGLKPDEGYWFGEHIGSVGPYIQSERLPHYQQYADQLVKGGLAYYSRITPEDFDRQRQATIAKQQPFVYRREFEPVDDGKTAGYPIRLVVNPGTTKWRDELRGEFTTHNDLIDEFVIIKADGYPTYNFANVIDDHLMKISHVIRGEEFLASTPKHALLYEYLGWQQPKFIHLPAILGPGGQKKLSKRDGDVDVLDYQKQGYLPTALVNFLALLGWNPGTEQEFFELDELIQAFSLEHLQKSPAVFDRERLNWFNGHYIRTLTPQKLVAALKPFVPEDWYSNESYFLRVVGLDQERLKTLSDARQLLVFFFETPRVDTALLTKNSPAEMIKQRLSLARRAVAQTDFSAKALEDALRPLTKELQIKPGELFAPIRVAITGTTASPGLFETMAVLGRDRVLERLDAAISSL